MSTVENEVETNRPAWIAPVFLDAHYRQRIGVIVCEPGDMQNVVAISQELDELKANHSYHNLRWPSELKHMNDWHLARMRWRHFWLGRAIDQMYLKYFRHTVTMVDEIPSSDVDYIWIDEPQFRTMICSVRAKTEFLTFAVESRIWELGLDPAKNWIPPGSTIRK